MSFHVEHALICVIPLQEKWASYQWCFPQLAKGVGCSSSFGVGNDVIGLMETKDILKHLHGLFKLGGEKEKSTYSRKHNWPQRVSMRLDTLGGFLRHEAKGQKSKATQKVS